MPHVRHVVASRAQIFVGQVKEGWDANCINNEVAQDTATVRTIVDGSKGFRSLLRLSLRYVIRLLRSTSFLSPAKAIFVPGIYFLGFSRYSKRVSSLQVNPLQRDEAMRKGGRKRVSTIVSTVVKCAGTKLTLLMLA